MKIVWCMYCENSPIANKQEKEERSSIQQIFSKMRSAGNKKEIALAQISNTNRQKVTNNSRNITINAAQSVTDGQIAMPTELQRDFLPPFVAWYSAFPARLDVIGKFQKICRTLLLKEKARRFLKFLEPSFCRQRPVSLASIQYESL
ncbi:hypothetical protein AVEN_156078-1 [Araneus ventricosus]|uniref:Uncharacterized protein n=1 Tax=Araneus ventricosus TaxID=182803 RepID=A0A4Y2T741_ARAVE|nr:hypothetical protein AVEN_156078-1 [Araneus ventricosus]